MYYKLKKLMLVIVCIIIMINIISIPLTSYATSYTQTVKSGIGAFPTEYQPLLNKLKELHPNWNFDAYYTGISWNDLIANETDCGHNRVIQNANGLWKDSCNNVAAGYACASESIIAYYLDPRNFLNDDVKVFQFLEISYNEKIHTVTGIKTVISGTFLDSNVTFTLNGQSKTMHYAEIILEAAKQSGMSPYSIATKIIQEVGSDGSGSVSGNYPGYEGYYNFYNYGAYDGDAAIANGLKYAREKSWNNQYTAIIDGAKLLADSYTNAGQNTAYFYKWDVVGSKILNSGQTQVVDTNQLFRHQFMTNIQDPTSQASTLYSTYLSNNIINENLNFVIPVYENMPSSNKLPTNLTKADGTLYYLNGTGVRVRSQASTSGTILATLYTLDEIVAVTERECATNNGIKWDKVKLSNGIVGYMASEYLTPCGTDSSSNNNTDTVIGTATTTDNLRLRASASTSGVTKCTIPKGTQISILQKDVANDGTNVWYKVNYNGTVGYVSSLYLSVSNNNSTNNTNGKYCKIDGNYLVTIPGTTINSVQSEYPGASGKIATGGTLTINGKQYVMVVKGDTNGDGAINSADLLKIVKHLNGASKMSNESYKKAGDINGDGAINSADLLKVVKHLNGTSTITL